METVNGKYADAVIFTEDLEDYARAQIQIIGRNRTGMIKREIRDYMCKEREKN